MLIPGGLPEIAPLTAAAPPAGLSTLVSCTRTQTPGGGKTCSESHGSSIGAELGTDWAWTRHEHDGPRPGFRDERSRSRARHRTRGPVAWLFI